MQQPVSPFAFGCIAGMVGGGAAVLVARSLGNIWIGVLGNYWAAVPAAAAGCFVTGVTLWRLSYRWILRTGMVGGASVSAAGSLLAPFVAGGLLSLQWSMLRPGEAAIPSVGALGLMALASVSPWSIPVAVLVGALCSRVAKTSDAEPPNNG